MSDVQDDTNAEPNEPPVAAPAKPPAERPAPRQPFVAGSALKPIIPSTLAEVARLSMTIHESGLAPYGLDQPEKVAVAIMYGAEIGLPPMQAVQSIAVINGRPSIYGDAATALVRASGLMMKFREWYSGTPFDDDYTAHCMVQRTGEDEQEFEFSVLDAKQAKLWEKRGRNGSDTPWITHPKRMLRWRARAFAFRDVFADVLRGFHFAEEVRDYPEKGNGEDVLPPRTPIHERLAGGGGEGFSREAIDEELSNGTAEAVAPAKEQEPEEEQIALSAGDAALLEDVATNLAAATSNREIDVIETNAAAAMEAADIQAQSPLVKQIAARIHARRLELSTPGAAKPKRKTKNEKPETLV